MSIKDIHSKIKKQDFNKYIKEYRLAIIINFIFIIIANTNIRYHYHIMNLARIILLWMFIYTISCSMSMNKLENKRFSSLMLHTNIIILIISSLALIVDVYYRFEIFFLGIVIMNLCNLLYFKYEYKNRKIIMNWTIVYILIFLLLLILYQKNNYIILIYILQITNLIMSYYNAFIYNNKSIKHYKGIKNLSYLNFIISVIIFLSMIYNNSTNNNTNIELLRVILLFFLFNHTYYEYKYAIKEIIHNPYYELKYKNEELKLSSQKLDDINEIIREEIKLKNKIKEKISSRKELLKQSLDTMPSIWMITDYQFNIIYKNNAFIELLGKDMDSFLEVVKLFKDKNFINCLECLIYNNQLLDKVVSLNQNVYILNINNNYIDNTYLICLTEITSELEMEKRLEDKNQEYESIISNIPCPIMIRNVCENPYETKVISINQEFEKLLGYSAEEIEGEKLIDYYEKLKLDFFNTKRYQKIKISNEEKIKIVDKIKDNNYIINFIMKDKYKREYNLEASIRDYTEYDIDEKLKIIIFRDKTKEVGIYEEINNQNKLYKQILHSMPEGIIVEAIDTREIIYVNNKFKDMFAIKEEKIGICTEKYRDRLEIKYEYNLNNKNMNKRVHILNEDRIIKEVKIYPKIWALGNLKCKVIMIEDLSEQIEAERMRSILIKQREYDRMKMDFYTNMSHELKTPLNNIHSSTQLVEKLKNDNKIKDNNGEVDYHIKIVKQNMFRLMRLIDNIINISQVKSEIYKLKSINFDIIYLVEEIVISINSYAKTRNLNLVFDTNEESLFVGLDPEAIERIVLNLLSNSIKFTESEGEIIVGVYKIQDKVKIVVKDNGVGIEKEKLIDIFDRFKQIENGNIDNEFGSGIGLCLSKSLVEIQDGNVDIKSEIGKGTEIIVEFPIKEVIEENEEIIDYDVNIEKFKIEFFDIYK